MPNVTGRYWTDAEPLLRAAGWTGSLVKGPDLANSRYSYNTIATQEPAPGRLVDAEAMITLQFAN
jgi:eukaryotic-like serine/threonine-protein kinase